MRDSSAGRRLWLPPLTGRGRMLGRVAWLLLLAVVSMIVWLQAAEPTGDRGFSNALTMGLLGLILILWLLWFLVGSRQPWWMRLAVPLGLVAAWWLFFTVFRFEAVSGNFVPRFALRASEKADRLLDQPDAGSAVVDLAATTPDDFPQFLGPDRSAAIHHVRLARDWDSNPPRLVWKREIGAGWSGFAVVNGHALTLEQRGDRELVTCYDVDTGEVEWARAIEARYDSTVAGHVLGSFQAIEGKSWNTFALYGSRLVVRNGREAAAYDLPLAG